MNKTLWTYWHQGFDSAPFVVKKCIDRFYQFHPEWTIYLLDKDSVHDFIEPVPLTSYAQENISIAHWSDLIRTQLLVKNGGVWADPTVYFMKPLDEWLPDYMDSGLFMFHRPGRDRIISNWFIAANRENILLEKVYTELIDFWNSYRFLNFNGDDTLQKQLNRIINRNLWLPRIWFSGIFQKVFRRFPYMVYHYKCYDVIRKYSESQKIYKTMPKYNADWPHKVQRMGMLAELTNESKEFFMETEIPLFKLNWKIDESKIKENTNLAYLFDT